MHLIHLDDRRWDSWHFRFIKFIKIHYDLKFNQNDVIEVMSITVCSKFNFLCITIPTAHFLYTYCDQSKREKLSNIPKLQYFICRFMFSIEIILHFIHAYIFTLQSTKALLDTHVTNVHSTSLIISHAIKTQPYSGSPRS